MEPEPYYERNGERRDWELHQEILSNQEALRFILEQSIQAAVEMGISEEEARQAFTPEQFRTDLL